MTEMVTRRRLSMPMWLATVIVLLAMGGGGWFVYRYITAEKTTPDTMVVGQGMPYGPPRSAVEARPSLASRFGFGGPEEGITARGAGAWTVRRGDAVMRASLEKGTYNITSFDYVYSAKQAWATAAQWDLHRLAVRVIDDSGLAQRLGVTADQKKQLAGLTYAAVITDADRKTLAGLLVKRDKTTGVAKETVGKELLAAVAAVGSAHLAETKAAMVKRVAGIPKVLTSQQIEQAKGGGGATTPPVGG
ncbi:MAG: hypothetical protein NTU53_18805 [Planctomycetota bacterium]|nr:hypothetical protein [Planctomycetota bacterium]